MNRIPLLSAALITRNEEDNLRELLPRLGWTGEVVVVDSGSTDGTVEVARSHGCRVAIHEFDTFARQRNRALGLARGDWVFSLDADERPTARLVGEIRRAIGNPRYAAWRVPIRSEILGRRVRRGGTQDDRPVRLFRRRAGRWRGDVHETLAVAGRIGSLAGWLEHRTLPTQGALLEKIDRYTRLEAQGRVRAGQPPRRGDAVVLPIREVFRRLIYKFGALDGPVGWQFALWSGYSQWVLARRHWQLWHEQPGAIRQPSAAPHPRLADINHVC
ncbi:MAG: glycosyltransferase family 2 protein [Pirellulales bacterium]|nr:glycosyltransferase family 2 protein [Pirellulales bacterium]